uniref:DNA topoisomerase 2 n=1 Tax=Globodera rostochiensis TaxID=31243 RepID=A0A914GY21_GLORO
MLISKYITFQQSLRNNFYNKRFAAMSIEATYKKVSQLEHVLLRPDTYIGSVECTKMTTWVYDSEANKMVFREISFVPGLYKIFDEILVNAADNKQRDSKMNVIKVDIDKENNQISVWNNGRGIPVVMHKVEKLYVPEMIFGTLLTSSNYNDDERKTTGGRNGYGAKLTNIFSSRFTVETSSSEYGKKFSQNWKNSMKKDGEPKISDAAKEDYTKVVFQPNLKLFKMEELEEDIIALMSRRAYDIAGTSKGVKVFLNGTRIPCQGFKEYVEQYTDQVKNDDGSPVKVVYETVNNRWEVALCISDIGNFKQVSFVNSISTPKGGTHVDLVAGQIAQSLVEVVKKKIAKNSMNVKPMQVKNHMWVFVNSLIENPSFDSQTKETLTLQAKSFGSKCDLSDKFLKEAAKCGIVDLVLNWVTFKENQLKDKTSGRKTAKLKGVPKLEDANEAGTKNSKRCTLILTEGDSAKTLAVAGLGVIGRDHYGVFPLRGKLLNVREASPKQIMENAEICNMIKIIGLQYKKKYESEQDIESLRYGKIMIMADQDQDGSHIKGLVINFIHTNWPSLIKRNFVEEFITPIVKATKGKEEKSFYSIPEYIEWRKNTENWKNWKIKYYKGLGTSTSKEAKEYFSDMLRHRIPFRYKDDTDDGAIELAFSKKKIEERKVWLTNWMEDRKQRREQGDHDIYLYNKDTRSITFSEFINKELVLFSNTDNERSIPSLVDGFKPGQRKVLFTCFKRADKKEVKVAQLAGAVGEMSAYHHGEQSLMSTIVNLAQNFVGSNNINLLLPIGQFGTRLQGGKDSASPRYIFTQLNPVTKALFPPVDEYVLRFLYEENQRIEPEWYCPVIPTVLVNGADGIGTGWSTTVPNYNPRELVANMRRLIHAEPIQPMVPWYKGFKGRITRLEETRFETRGLLNIIDDGNNDLAYKERVVEPMFDGSDKKPQLLQDYKEYHTDQTVHFVCKLKPDELVNAERKGIYDVFGLKSSVNTSNMVLFDAAGCLRKFDSPEQICLEFFECRKGMYIKRKRYLEGMLQAQSDQLSEKARFIMMKIRNEIHIENKRKSAIVEQLQKHNFRPDPVKRWKDEQKRKELEQCGEANVSDDDDEEQDEQVAQEVDAVLEKRCSDYDYLVGMAIWKLSMEDKDKMLAESETKKKELVVLKKKEWSDLYEEDLNEFLKALDAQEEKEQKEAGSENVRKEKGGVKKKGGVVLDARLRGATRREPNGPDPNYAAEKKPKKKVVREPKAETSKGKKVAGKRKSSEAPPPKKDAKVTNKKKDGASKVKKMKIESDEDEENVSMDSADIVAQPPPKKGGKVVRKASIVKKMKIESDEDEENVSWNSDSDAEKSSSTVSIDEDGDYE